MKNDDLKTYIKRLLNNPNINKKTIDEIQNIQLLLSVYSLGLQGQKFPIDYLYKIFNLEEDIPREFHTLVGKMAIIKSEEKINDYILENTKQLLDDFYNYFI